MRESRLFQIIYQLLTKKKVTAANLAKQFEVSVRTIYRDIDALSSSGIPIYASQGKNGGIQLDEDFVLSKSLLSQEEKEQILDGLQGLGSVNGIVNDKQLLTKLSALFKVKNPNWIEVQFSPWQNHDQQQKLVQLIKEAICQKHFFSFLYFSSLAKQTKRRVKPVRLVFKGQDWYLYAYCLLRQNYRFFKLSRIKEWQISSDCFEDDFSEILIKTDFDYDSTVHLSLKFAPQLAFRVYYEFSDVTADQEGSLYAEIDLPDNDVLESYLLSFGEGLEVLQPETLRQAIQKKLKKMLTIYKT
ncbi:YafY family transcriptional regulator [Streptococcus mutans]|nr:YafY family transcriptional regulator [Streptococcus mutans]